MVKDKLDFILPGAMRDNDVDMWIHIGRNNGVFANPHHGSLALYCGGISGYLIFTDLGDRIERACFHDSFGGGSVGNIAVRSSRELGRAITGYDYHTQDFSVYDEISVYNLN